jgi:hypothetical protein
MAPTKEEESKLKEFKDESPFKLGPAEKFLKVMLDIPFAFKRMDAMLYIANFDSELEYLKKSFDTLEVFIIRTFLSIDFTPMELVELSDPSISTKLNISLYFKNLILLCTRVFMMFLQFS